MDTINALAFSPRAEYNKVLCGIFTMTITPRGRPLPLSLRIYLWCQFFLGGYIRLLLPLCLRHESRHLPESVALFGTANLLSIMRSHQLKSSALLASSSWRPTRPWFLQDEMSSAETSKLPSYKMPRC